MAQHYMTDTDLLREMLEGHAEGCQDSIIAEWRAEFTAAPDEIARVLAEWRSAGQRSTCPMYH